MITSGAAFLKTISESSLRQTLFEHRNAIAVVSDMPDFDTGYHIRTILEAGSAIREDPLGNNTSILIQKLWQNMDHVARFETHQTLELCICRHVTMSSNISAWHWFEDVAMERCRQIASSEPVEGMCWFDGIVRVVHGLILASAPSCDIFPQQFTTMVVQPYHYLAPPSRAYLPDELVNKVVSISSDILATWLDFDLNSTARRQAWFASILVEYCGADVLYLGEVWSAYAHVKQAIFNNRRLGAFKRNKFNTVIEILRTHPIAIPGSEENTIMCEIGDIIRTYIELQSVGQRDIPSGEDIIAGKTSYLMDDSDDEVMLTGVHQFVDYLRRLKPLIDGSYSGDDGGDILLRVAIEDPDAFLPFRERTPSRLRVLGPDGPYREDFLRTPSGMFGPTVFRGITYRANVLRLPTFPVFYRTLQDFEESVEGKDLEDIRHLTAYHRANPARTPQLAATYWKSSQKWPEQFERNGGSRSLDFDSCVKFLTAGKPKPFPQIGQLAAFLTAGDLAYTSAVDMPDIPKIAEHMAQIDKGAANALRKLKIINSKASGQDMHGFVDKTRQFYQILGELLTEDEKMVMGLDGLMMEYALCKYSIAATRRWV